MIVKGDCIFWILSFNLLSDAAYATTSPVALISPPTCSLAATAVPAVPILTLPPGLKNKSVEPPVDIVLAPVADENDIDVESADNVNPLLIMLTAPPSLILIAVLAPVAYESVVAIYILVP